MSLRIVYMGTPDFAVAPLKALLEARFEIVGVVTNPDKPAGRGQKLQESAVKQFAKEKEIPILQPQKFRDELFLQQLKDLNVDLQIVVAFKMLPEVVWNMPRFGTLNLHASLLPHYRGAAPINWAIINGEKETGVSTFLLQHEIDTGNIIFQEKTTIGENDNAEVVHDKLMNIGADLVVKTAKAIEKGDYPKIPQEKLISKQENLKLAPKIFKEDCKIDWTKNIECIYNLIRGLSPYPAAWTELLPVGEGKKTMLKIFAGEKEISEHNEAYGTLLTDGKNYLKVAVPDGFLSISLLQQAGKKRMKTEDFLRGFQQLSNYHF